MTASEFAIGSARPVITVLLTLMFPPISNTRFVVPSVLIAWLLSTLNAVTPAVTNLNSSLSAPALDSASIKVSWSTSLTPPRLAHAVPM